MNHPVAIVVVDPWRTLTLTLAVAAILLAAWSLWRRTTEAQLMAEIEEHCADILEQAGQYGDAAQCLGRAQRWRRLAWPRRARATARRGES